MSSFPSPTPTSEHAPSTHIFSHIHLSTTTHVTTSVLDHGARSGGVSSDSALPLVGSHRGQATGRSTYTGPVSSVVHVFPLSTRHCFGLGPRCSFPRSVFGQRPAPCGNHRGQAAGRSTFSGPVSSVAYALSFPHDCAYRNCATGHALTVALLDKHGSAPLAHHRWVRRRLSRLRSDLSGDYSLSAWRRVPIDVRYHAANRSVETTRRTTLAPNKLLVLLLL